MSFWGGGFNQPDDVMNANAEETVKIVPLKVKVCVKVELRSQRHAKGRAVKPEFLI